MALPPSWAFDVFTAHLLIVECYSVHLMVCFPFFLLMPIILDCGQTQLVHVVNTIDYDSVSSSMCANIHYPEGKLTLGDKCGMC